MPYTRGAEFSRPVASIVTEAKRMIAGGTREITLLGQNVNAYHGEGADGKPVSLAGLIYQLAEIEGLERLRYTTSHPLEMTEELCKAISPFARSGGLRSYSGGDEPAPYGR